MVRVRKTFVLSDRKTRHSTLAVGVVSGLLVAVIVLLLILLLLRRQQIKRKRIIRRKMQETAVGLWFWIKND